jgi:large subunit ribosomal protein L24
MIKSSKPRYQRFFRFNAPMHVKQHFVHAHIDKALRSKLKISARSVQISKGDTVKVMSGAKRGTSGKVTAVNMRTGRVAIDSLSRKNARGKESPRSVHVSSIYITELNLSDKWRAGKLKLQPVIEKKDKQASIPQQKPAAAAVPQHDRKTEVKAAAPVAAAGAANK